MTLPPIPARVLALCCGAAALTACFYYPFQRTWLAPILLLYGAALCRPRPLWLFALPALLPVLDLAPWTGWFYFEEIDLLVLMTAAFGYWRLAGAPARPCARLPGLAVAGLGAVTLAYLVAAGRGLPPLAALDGNAFSSYFSSYNSLRLGKSWCQVLLLLPLLRRDAGAQCENLARYVAPGMLTGLALVSGAALWERLVFPGLLNFSADYRTTAPFSGMHTGGAALDGYLALGFPFVATCLLARPSRLRDAVLLLLLALGAYAGLSTFSRGVYAAYAVSIALLGWFALAPAVRARPLKPALLLMAAAAPLVTALIFVFSSSGYRGLGAALGVLAAGAVLAGMPMARAPLAAVAGGCAAELALAGLLSTLGQYDAGILKPPYLLFCLSALVFAGGAWRLAGARTGQRIGHSARMARPGPAGVALAAACALALNAVWIALHWGGTNALAPAALVTTLALLPPALALARRRPLWQLGRAGLHGIGACAIVLMLALPISASYYAAERFAASATSLQQRWRHWTQVVQLIDDNAAAHAFGMGLGTFPVTYFWRNQLHEAPARFDYADDTTPTGRQRYLRLTPPRYARGYGELLRLLQRVQPQPRTRYLLAFDARGGDNNSLLHARLCERLLLYPRNCVTAPVQLTAPAATWHHYQVSLDSGPLGAAPWWRRAPVQLELALEGGTSVLDIDNISLDDPVSGEALLRNGGFSDTNNYWFFSSDRHHLPWHVKNLALYLYFELGLLGLLAVTALSTLTMAHLWARAGAGEPRAGIYLAALAGFMVVGLFDSLLDVPRISLLFFLLLCCALLLPARLTSPSPPPSPTTEPCP